MAERLARRLFGALSGLMACEAEARRVERTRLRPPGKLVETVARTAWPGLLGCQTETIPLVGGSLTQIVT